MREKSGNFIKSQRKFEICQGNLMQFVWYETIINIKMNIKFILLSLFNKSWVEILIFILECSWLPYWQKFSFGKTKCGYLIKFGLTTYFHQLVLSELSDPVDESFNKTIQEDSNGPFLKILGPRESDGDQSVLRHPFRHAIEYIKVLCFVMPFHQAS